jgi:hypothetical protein
MTAVPAARLRQIPAVLAAAALVLAGCAGAVATAPCQPGHNDACPTGNAGGGPPEAALASVVDRVVMPSQGSVTLEEPGGDAPDAHAASLAAMLKAPWGWQQDKDDQVHIMLPDAEHWKRVRYHGFEHLAGFRYGRDHHAVSVVLVEDTREGRAPTSESCMRHIETLARSRIREFTVELQPMVEKRVSWREKTLLIHLVDGTFPFGLRQVSFSAAWIAFPAYASSCLYVAFGAQYEGHPELARRLRDRWSAEAATQIDIRTTTKPYRH